MFSNILCKPTDNDSRIRKELVDPVAGFSNLTELDGGEDLGNSTCKAGKEPRVIIGITIAGASPSLCI